MARKDDPFTTVNVPKSLKHLIDEKKNPHEPRYALIERILVGEKK